MFKKHSKGVGLHKLTRHYWFTIQSPNGQTLATSETYTTAAMRDKGIEAVKKVVWWDNIQGMVPGKLKNSKKPAGKKRPLGGRDLRAVTSDTFHLENKHGKITKR